MSDDTYDYPFRVERRRHDRRRAGRRGIVPGFGGGPLAYGNEYSPRMGMHDLTEHYGRYSGGSRYSYEYSERTVDHPHRREQEPVGFTRPLRSRRRDSGRPGRGGGGPRRR